MRVSSAAAETGSFDTSDARAARLLGSILQGRRANTPGIPADCPQCERMGWTGDIEWAPAR